MRAVLPILFAFATTCVVSAPVSAQGTLRFAWQGSVDGGATWVGDRVEVADPDAEVLVRAQIRWEDSPGYALASAWYDVTITCVQGAGLGDEVVGINRIEPFTSAQQTVVATRFGAVVKIDDVRDDMPPGVGTRSVVSSQVAEMFGLPFSRENPVNFFQFSFALDGTLGTRVVSHIFPVTSGGAVTAPALYTTPRAGVTIPFAISFPLEIVVVPAPGVGFLGACGAFVLVGRRRRSTGGER
jgi:hypothetical protein